MSHDTQSQKADQITFHFYTKLFYVVNDARATAIPELGNSGKTDKWFNLETPDSDLWTKDGRDRYKTISAFPPLEIQVLLTVPDSLTNNQVLVYIAPDSSRVPIDSTFKYVLLECWTLDLNLKDVSPSPSSSSSSSDSSVELPTLYKHGIPLFRSLYTLLHILPAWKLSRRFRTRRLNGASGGGLGVQVRVKGDLGSGIDESSVMRFDSPLALPTSTHRFPPLQHPMGALTLTATYLSTPNFRIDEMESLLSSRFMSMDTGGTRGMDFVPTLVKNQQRDEMLSSRGGSQGTRSRLSSGPRSPPRDIIRAPSQPYPYSHSRTPSDADSVAERFIIPSRPASSSNPNPIPSSASDLSRHTNTNTNTNTNPVFPITRATTTTSTSTQPQLTGLAARLRQESLGRSTAGAAVSDSYLPASSGTATTSAGLGLVGTSADSTRNTTQGLPFPSSSSYSSSSSISGTSVPTTSAPMPVSVRRPGINPVHPFKSNTLATAIAGSAGSGSAGSSRSALGGLTTVGGGVGGFLPSSSPSSRGGAGVLLSGSPSTGLTSLSSLSNLANLPRTAVATGPLTASSTLPSFTPSSLGSVGAAGTGSGSGSATGVGASASSGGATATMGNTITAGIASTTGTDTGEIPVPRRKRYSSSFGHRYSSPARGSVGGSSGGVSGSQGGSIGAGPGGTEGAGAGSVGSSQGSRRSGGKDSRRSSLLNAPAPPSPADPDLSGPPDSLFQPDSQDDHDSISSFMQDIDTRKPLIGRSRIYAHAQAELERQSIPSSPSGEQAEERERGTRGGLGLVGAEAGIEDVEELVDHNGEERQRTIRARALWDGNNKDKDKAIRSGFSGLEDVPPLSPLGTAARRLSAGSGAGVSFTPHSHSTPQTPSSSSPRRRSYTGTTTGLSLSPPSSPLRNVIPLAPEDDYDIDEGQPSATVSAARAPYSPLNPSSSSTGTPEAGVPARTAKAEGLPSSPPAHSSPMLTSVSDVEAKLKKMNDVFLASLEGLGGRGRSGKGRGRERGE